MMDRSRFKRISYIVLVVLFLLIVNISLGYLLTRQAKTAIITLMQTRMLDISNTAAAMINGDTLEAVTPEDKGTEAYESIMRTLSYFQDNIDLRYIYCVRDMGDGTFTFGLDPTVEDPGEFGSPIVYTDALYKASKGTASADETPYHDSWGSFYSAYSPVFDSSKKVAGIIAVDFDAAWYNQQLTMLTRTTIVVAIISLLIGGSIVFFIAAKNAKKINEIHGQLHEMANTLLHEMGTSKEETDRTDQSKQEDDLSMDGIEKQIQSMQSELRTQIAHVHVQAIRDGLTGVKSKLAYLEMENELDEKLSKGEVGDFAIVVCDVNGLKKINDTQGHAAGDEYIRKACKMICDVFSHSPVYRIGGDEFVAILMGRDYDNRSILMSELHNLSSSHIGTGEAIVSGGMSEYRRDQDHSIREIFERADASMYKDKVILKSLGAVTRDEESVEILSPGEIPAHKMRKHILIADDVETNREVLGDLLEEDYDIFYAADGAEALDMLRQHKDEIALVLLDLYMPNVTGREVLKTMQVDEELMSIPVIVITVDQNAELDCLKIGAMDFIPKPYPDIEIVKARIAKCIELSENRALIRHTELDKLTGLYNFDYFIRYVEIFDQQYKEFAFDAFVCEINKFHRVNDQYGREFGDLVLRSIGVSIKKFARKAGGIGCRQGGDTFFVYCPHRDDYEQLLKKFCSELFVEKETANKVSLRFGIYPNAEQEPNIEQRFSCARIAAYAVANNPDKACGYYIKH